jgi:asparagine synthase (glutamine-hydrolysing)
VSGFAGMACGQGAAPDARLLDRMAARLAFRGPDATHLWTKPGAGFCFTFLRTGPAPQAESQPVSLDGHVWLLGDVRLDGREELWRRLEQHGEGVPAEATDEELLLRAWRRWGEAGCADLSGDFSFALWDAEARHLWCVRDLIGVRPLFYAQAGDRLYFSNTLEAIRAAPEISSALDAQFIGDFLLQAWCPDAERTVFRAIRRLPPGHLLEYSSAGLRIRRYATLPVEEPLWRKRPEEYVEEFRGLLEQAVRERLPRGPAAIFLSGGLDSSSVAALAAKVAKECGQVTSLRACTVDYRPLFDDEEGQYASRAAAHLGIAIDVLSGANCLPFTEGGEPRLRTPEPCHEPFLALQVEHYRHVAARARVAISGDGGDDILTGQAWPYLVYLLRRLRFGTIADAFGGYFLKHGRIPPLRAGFRTRLRQWLGRRPDSLTGCPRWLAPQFEKELHLRERWHELQRTPEAIHPLHPVGYATLTSAYWPSVLEGEDAAWTGVAVETRTPLLDQRVLRFLLRLPPVPWCMDKEILRQAVRGLLPEEIRLRPKTPLRGDPLLSHVENFHWSPLPPSQPAPALRAYVDWERFCAILNKSTGAALWDDLRPVPLNRWLKTIENEEWIK